MREGEGEEMKKGGRDREGLKGGCELEGGGNGQFSLSLLSFFISPFVPFFCSVCIL